MTEGEPNGSHAGGFAALAVFTQAMLLVATLMIGHVLARKKVSWIGEAGIALLLGLAIGALVLSPLVDAHGTFGTFIGFSTEFFMLAILPPIIFESGWSMDVEKFFANSGAIACFAFVGTLLSTFSIALLVWAAGALGLCTSVSFLEASIFGSIISATDPVTVLAVFQRLGVDANMFALVLGESLLNDAVSMVLFTSLSTFLQVPITGGAVAYSVLVFVGIFVGSMAVGAAVAFTAAAVVKLQYFRSEHMPLESCLVILFAFSSYWLADGLHLSGIVSILFNAIAAAHFVRPNMSRRSQDRVSAFFKLLSCLAETSVFLFIGASIFLDQQDLSSRRLLPFVAVTFVALAMSRAVNVWPCAALTNFLRVPAQRIPQAHQFMLWWSGLRGAMAFAIALEAADVLPDGRGELMLSAVYLIILATVMCNGGACASLIDSLSLRQQQQQENQHQQPEISDPAAALPFKKQVELHSSPCPASSPEGVISTAVEVYPTGDVAVLDNSWADTTAIPADALLPLHSSPTSGRPSSSPSRNFLSKSIEKLRQANQSAGVLSKLERLDKRFLGPLFLAPGLGATCQHGSHGGAGDVDQPVEPQQPASPAEVPASMQERM